MRPAVRAVGRYPLINLLARGSHGPWPRAPSGSPCEVQATLSANKASADATILRSSRPHTTLRRKGLLQGPFRKSASFRWARFNASRCLQRPRRRTGDIS